MSGKSKEEIAFELVAKLKGVGIWGENNIEAILDMYAQCLEATSGLRVLDGKLPVALRLQGQNAAPARAQVKPAPAQATPAVAAHVPAPAPALRQAAPLQQPAVQPLAAPQPQIRQQQQLAAQPAQQRPQ